jgi:hypothetical protein
VTSASTISSSSGHRKAPRPDPTATSRVEAAQRADHPAYPWQAAGALEPVQAQAGRGRSGDRLIVIELRAPERTARIRGCDRQVV